MRRFTVEYGSDKAPGAAVAIMTVFCWGAKEEVGQVVKKWQSPQSERAGHCGRMVHQNVF